MKKRIAIFLIGIILCISICGCGASTGTKSYDVHTTLVKIEGRDNLYYDANSKIVYFLFNEYAGQTGYGYMSAYYAPNGFPYLYDVNNNELVEIKYDFYRKTDL